MEGPSLKNFDRRSLRWKIVARIARLWEHSSIDKTEFYGLIFVMVDKKNNTLEGLIPAESVPKFKEKVQEGVVYIIEKFDAIKARQKYKAVDHPWRLCFIPRTLVEPIIPQPENFPMLACTLLPFSQLEKRMKEIVIMSDVVGRVTSFTEIIPPSGNAREQRRQVFITDGSQNAVVTLWGESADAFDASRVLQRSKHEPIVAIFIAVFVDQYSGMLAFKSTRGTRCHINVHVPEVSAILENTRTIPNEIEPRQTGPSPSKPTEATITELSKMHPTDIMDEFYTMKIQVTAIVSNESDWWYMSCKECLKKLKIEDDTYKCSDCGASKPIARYMILVHAIDIRQSNIDDAKFAQFAFFGQQGEAIVGKDVQFLSAYSGVRPNNVPSEIDALLGKKYTVTVTPSKMSLRAAYHHYNVKKVELLKEPTNETVMQASSSSTPQQHTQQPSEDATANIEEDHLNATPPSADSVSEKNQLISSAAEEEMHNTTSSLEDKNKPANDPASELRSKRQITKELFPSENPKGKKKK